MVLQKTDFLSYWKKLFIIVEISKNDLSVERNPLQEFTPRLIFSEKGFPSEDPLSGKIKSAIESIPYLERNLNPVEFLFHSNQNSILPISRFLQTLG
jgi:hypothetical protein